MKAQFASYLIVVTACAGCANRTTQPVIGPDYTHRLERQQLRGQPIPAPSSTPYDGNDELRSAFLSGFNRGWDVALEYWLGNMIAIPEAYQQPAEKTKAWQDGYNAGQQTLYERVRSISSATSPH